MATQTKILAIALAAGLLAACGNTTEIAQMPVKGGTFEKGLRDGYVRLANEEYDQTDIGSGDEFAERAKMSAMGKFPVPEDIAARKLVAPHRDELASARERLMSAFGNRAAQKVPDAAADAQVSFDCWMEQAEENIQPEDIAACRSRFMAAMQRIDAALAAKPVAAAKPRPAPRVRKPQSTVYVLYFDLNSAKLNASAKSVIDLIKGDVKKGATISLAGYADRSGSVDYNKILSGRRAKVVADALSNAGVAGKIAATAYGEARNAVETKDGARERLNRRVEVSVTQ